MLPHRPLVPESLRAPRAAEGPAAGVLRVGAAAASRPRLEGGRNELAPVRGPVPRGVVREAADPARPEAARGSVLGIRPVIRPGGGSARAGGPRLQARPRPTRLQVGVGPGVLRPKVVLEPLRRPERPPRAQPAGEGGGATGPAATAVAPSPACPAGQGVGVPRSLLRKLAGAEGTAEPGRSVPAVRRQLLPRQAITSPPPRRVPSPLNRPTERQGLAPPRPASK